MKNIITAIIILAGTFQVQVFAQKPPITSPTNVVINHVGDLASKSHYYEMTWKHPNPSIVAYYIIYAKDKNSWELIGHSKNVSFNLPSFDDSKINYYAVEAMPKDSDNYSISTTNTSLQNAPTDTAQNIVLKTSYDICKNTLTLTW
ncbi:MAG TPA: hypothetical protein VIO15_00130, partial [Bacteroidales bacterium]